MFENTVQPSQTSSVGTPTESVAPSQANNTDSELASRFAKLTQKERAFQKMQGDIKSEREELAKYRQLKQNAALNPNALLEEFGLSYGQLTEHVLKPKEDEKYQTIEQRIARIEEEKRQSELQAHEAKQNEAYAQGISTIKQFVEEHADEYEYVKLNDAYEDVLELAAKYYKETGKYLSFSEAANLVEKHFEGEADKYAQAKKLQAKFSKTEGTDAPVFGKPLSQNSLSNDTKTTTSPTEPNLDDKVLMERAVAAYRNARIKK